MSNPWRDAYAELEEQICDLPRWVNICRCVNEGRDTFGEQEQLEALTLALDELHDKAVKLQETYLRLAEETATEALGGPRPGGVRIGFTGATTRGPVTAGPFSYHPVALTAAASARR